MSAYRDDTGTAQVDFTEISFGRVIDHKDGGFRLGENGGDALGPEFCIEDDKNSADSGDAKQDDGQLDTILHMDRDPVAAIDPGSPQP